MSETPTGPDLEQMSGDELREQLTEAGLPTAGRVTELRDRLTAHLEQQAATPQEPDEPTVAPDAADVPDEAPSEPQEAQGGDDDETADTAEEIKAWRAVGAMMTPDGKSVIPDGAVFQAPASDGRTKRAVEVKPEQPTDEQAAALEAASGQA